MVVAALLLWSGATAGAATVAASATSGVAGTTAEPVSPEEARFVELINVVRSKHGVGPLTIDPGLRASAQAWSGNLAAAGVLAHGDLGALLGGYRAVAENLAMAASVDEAFNALVASPGHAANLLNPTYTVIGVGVSRMADGRLVTCQLFAG